MKHIGAALGFAAETEGYPERVWCVSGELYHAYRECPDRNLAQRLRKTYDRILETGCVPDLTRILKDAHRGWKKNQREAKYASNADQSSRSISLQSISANEP